MNSDKTFYVTEKQLRELGELIEAAGAAYTATTTASGKDMSVTTGSSCG